MVYLLKHRVTLRVVSIVSNITFSDLVILFSAIWLRILRLQCSSCRLISSYTAEVRYLQRMQQHLGHSAQGQNGRESAVCIPLVRDTNNTENVTLHYWNGLKITRASLSRGFLFQNPKLTSVTHESNSQRSLKILKNLQKWLLCLLLRWMLFSERRSQLR